MGRLFLLLIVVGFVVYARSDKTLPARPPTKATESPAVVPYPVPDLGPMPRLLPPAVPTPTPTPAPTPKPVAIVPIPEPEFEDDGSVAGFRFRLEGGGRIYATSYEYSREKEIFYIAGAGGVKTTVINDRVVAIDELTATELAHFSNRSMKGFIIAAKKSPPVSAIPESFSTAVRESVDGEYFHAVPGRAGRVDPNLSFAEHIAGGRRGGWYKYSSERKTFVNRSRGRR